MCVGDGLILQGTRNGVICDISSRDLMVSTICDLWLYFIDRPLVEASKRRRWKRYCLSLFGLLMHATLRGVFFGSLKRDCCSMGECWAADKSN